MALKFEESPSIGIETDGHFNFRYRMDSTAHTQRRSHRERKKFILCFDGTGNKFSGTEADSNILKIYRMLDRSDDSQFHYYQPGIAVGTSLPDHVMGGYKFLMRYYLPGDDIYLFGFSRGAYTARFLAEMLDHVGLLSAGNEEMCNFAWKTFQKWQCREEDSDDDKRLKRELLEYMCAFRETFSRPVRPIRFLGLFDTVNSVPRFENAWMQRSKFPYTARSSAKVIRHAVAIDERRAKFRQDLISEEKPIKARYRKSKHKHSHTSPLDGAAEKPDGERGRRTSKLGTNRRETLAIPERYRDRSETAGVRSLSPSYSRTSNASQPCSGASSVSNFSMAAIQQRADPTDSEEEEQNIQEVWFAGCHADIGGGWPLALGEEAPLSHVPLVWMVREAERAGLKFDSIKLHDLNCGYEEPLEEPRSGHETLAVVPTIEIDSASPVPTDEGLNSMPVSEPIDGTNDADIGGEKGSERKQHLPLHAHMSKFHKHFHSSATCGKIHDVLQFRNGVSAMSVISWNVMEYLPFRRMDLQEDGSWKSITWPLPKGEVRDIPDNAVIHSSVIRRMRSDPTYRPGNLIVGGGGRGVRVAPQNMGTGKWLVHREEGHPVGECFVRAEPPERKKSDEPMTPICVAPNGPQGI
ncbi:hypothetical protein P154DRAFT_622018 [Amniculicola lignicola CBS 123094]|uniref:T6SS Phospholipase effector Tle1-like catalytic domain-containing protein n=1 Tax=Amniculicola lignicola CBS 123094 TaxID=1392246 RepID=A0A6A5W7X4_9PLEO|nr:hypothetical protein P154DRAFT_622018 [Amniculicola lignicola CBS 123094]